MALMETIAAFKPPLEKDADGVFRVGGTRVRYTVLVAFQQGYTPEAIAYKYPALQLSDIYAVIAYYLQHQEELDAYLAQREEQARVAEQEIEACFPSAGIRERLLARRTNKT